MISIKQKKKSKIHSHEKKKKKTPEGNTPKCYRWLSLTYRWFLFSFLHSSGGLNVSVVSIHLFL